MDDGAMRNKLTEIERRTGRLEDIEQARVLLHSYAAVLDDPIPETIADLFDDYATLGTAKAKYVGRAQIVEFFRNARTTDNSVKRHFVMSPDVEWVAPGRVKLSSYFIYTARHSDRVVLGWGTYDDVVIVEPEWTRFAAKFIDIHFSGDLADDGVAVRSAVAP